jgi:hypothetical protein
MTTKRFKAYVTCYIETLDREFVPIHKDEISGETLDKLAGLVNRLMERDWDGFGGGEKAVHKSENKLTISGLLAIGTVLDYELTLFKVDKRGDKVDASEAETVKLVECINE